MLVLTPLPPPARLRSQLLFLPSCSFSRPPCCAQNALGTVPLKSFALGFPSAQNALPPQPQFLSYILQVSVQKFPSQLSLPSKTSYIICGTQCKTKIQRLLFQKILIKALRNLAVVTLTQSYPNVFKHRSLFPSL